MRLLIPNGDPKLGPLLTPLTLSLKGVVSLLVCWEFFPVGEKGKNAAPLLPQKEKRMSFFSKVKAFAQDCVNEGEYVERLKEEAKLCIPQDNDEWGVCALGTAAVGATATALGASVVSTVAVALGAGVVSTYGYNKARQIMADRAEEKMVTKKDLDEAAERLAFLRECAEMSRIK